MELQVTAGKVSTGLSSDMWAAISEFTDSDGQSCSSCFADIEHVDMTVTVLWLEIFLYNGRMKEDTVRFLMRKLHIFHRSVIYCCFPGHSLQSKAETNSLLGFTSRLVFTSDKIITKLITNVTQLSRLLESHEKLRWLLCCDT